jgi:electron transfer flavoprotein alpha subunit
VVAINKDPKAAIFHHADIAVVEALETFLPLLIEACGQKED